MLDLWQTLTCHWLNYRLSPNVWTNNIYVHTEHAYNSTHRPQCSQFHTVTAHMSIGSRCQNPQQKSVRIPQTFRHDIRIHKHTIKIQSAFHGLDWIEQGLSSPATQYRLSGRQFYRSKEVTNSIKVLKGKVGQPQTGRGSKPTRGLPPCYKWTTEKKKNPITVGQTQRDKAPHSRPTCTSPV